MLIGELSKRSGFSRDTIRYYEKIALIELPANARREYNYKDYPEGVLAQLRVIRKYKELGFTLEEIRELLVRESLDVLDVAKVIELVDLKLAGVNEELEKLHELKMRLNREREVLGRKKVGHIIQLPEMKLAA